MSDGRLQSSRDDHRRRDHGDRRENRRSRSPHDRRNQRRGQPEVDSYSSQRGYREREREDRYGGGRGDRRDDRQWGGDRGSARRDARRDDDGDRRRGGDRRGGDDLFGDRRGPPRGSRDDRAPREDNRDRGRDRDDMRQLENQSKRKSASPPRKPKEPTPDLTDIVPILEKPRRMTQWDVKPPGYENVTAEQAKLSGMFPLPGAPRVPAMDANRLKEFMAQPGSQANTSALKPSSARQSKRLLVYNLPASATDDSLMDFFNLQLNGLNVTKGADPCISANISQGNGYALLEFKTPEDATNAMAMDGIKMEADVDMGNGESNGTSKGLEIKRPKDYIVPTVSDETENTSGLFSSIVPDTQNKISITNIPVYLQEEQVVELLTSFGQLKNFVLVKDKSTEESRGIAFVEYKDPDSTTKIALEALNGMDLGDAALKVKLASIGIQQVSGEMTVGAMGLIAGTKSTDADNGRVLCLMNMITPEELMDADEADEILEDVKEECAKYGELMEVKMPRPTGGSRQNNGIGKIYLKYKAPDSAAKALGALAGRKFADRTVVVTYFGEEYFDVNAW
ncbi:splicing factor u2af large subunit like protein [Zymoseptoria brevis]|uniref:Splicing factor U2AF subunit n=1 Tax=Zymoseptoria brevis TaxID=1047168 RepID=A0A0F4GE06_9PEZI|nr:splicing factor u2af large subunit like protein [Zymoseptoria brevis]